MNFDLKTSVSDPNTIEYIKNLKKNLLVIKKKSNKEEKKQKNQENLIFEKSQIEKNSKEIKKITKKEDLKGEEDFGKRKTDDNFFIILKNLKKEVVHEIKKKDKTEFYINGENKKIKIKLEKKKKKKLNIHSKCNCKNSHCLKLYCECFKKNGFCSQSCSCKNCFNQKNSSLRESKISSVKLKNPKAFENKFSVENSKNENNIDFLKVISSRGCNCKNSNCKKKYCECFQYGISCGPKCNCINCLNGSNYGESTKFIKFKNQKGFKEFTKIEKEHKRKSIIRMKRLFA